MHPKSAALGILLLLGIVGIPPVVTHADSETPTRVPIQRRRSGRGPTVRVLEETDQGVRLEFELPAIEVQPIEVDGETYHVLAIEGGEFEGEIGSPMLPTFGRLIQIPDDAGVSFETTVVETRELSGLPADADAAGRAGGVRDRPRGLRAGRLRRGAPGAARASRRWRATCASCRSSFAPVRYDPARGTVEVAGRIEVRVQLRGDGPAQHARRGTPRSCRSRSTGSTGSWSSTTGARGTARSSGAGRLRPHLPEQPDRDQPPAAAGRVAHAQGLRGPSGDDGRDRHEQRGASRPGCRTRTTPGRTRPSTSPWSGTSAARSRSRTGRRPTPGTAARPTIPTRSSPAATSWPTRTSAASRSTRPIA